MSKAFGLDQLASRSGAVKVALVFMPLLEWRQDASVAWRRLNSTSHSTPRAAAATERTAPILGAAVPNAPTHPATL